jgi:hypothetical protein
VFTCLSCNGGLTSGTFFCKYLSSESWSIFCRTGPAMAGSVMKRRPQSSKKGFYPIRKKVWHAITRMKRNANDRRCRAAAPSKSCDEAVALHAAGKMTEVKVTIQCPFVQAPMAAITCKSRHGTRSSFRGQSSSSSRQLRPLELQTLMYLRQDECRQAMPIACSTYV